MSLTYIFREDPNYRQNITLNTTYTPSVDRVVDRIYDLAGEISDVGRTVNKYGAGVGDKAKLTVENLNVYFQNLSHGAHTVGNITVDKFDGFPVTPFYIVLICALIVIIIALCYFISYGSHYFVQRRYEKQLKPELDQQEI
uniref:Uncharacterized protein n=1 Tax=Panagrolaimus superbus TaxID=310955 RepID=A0A914Z2T4_9BILA